jgi:hypothetical protein
LWEKGLSPRSVGCIPSCNTPPVSIAGMYSPRPGFVPRSRVPRVVGLALFTLCLAGLGAYVLNYTIEGWNQGAISISGRSGRTYIATRAGDHWLLFYVWVSYSAIAGAGLILVALYGFITSLRRQPDE